MSIVIPALNESENLSRLIPAVAQLPNAEIIVTDGGSADGTPETLESLKSAHANFQWTHAPQGRAVQMNSGATLATGEWLLFLHADTELPADSFASFLREIHLNPALNSGAFEFRVRNPRFVYRYLEFYVRFRSRWLKLPFGDQALFVRRSLFESLGGFRADYPLMEDMELVGRLTKHKGFQVLNAPVYTSARRYETEGYFKRSCSNLYLQFLYKCGMHPKELAKRYYPNFPVR